MDAKGKQIRLTAGEIAQLWIQYLLSFLRLLSLSIMIMICY